MQSSQVLVSLLPLFSSLHLLLQLFLSAYHPAELHFDLTAFVVCDLAPAVYTQDMVEYIKAVSNEWIEHFEMYSQTEYIDDAEFFIMEPFQTWNKTPSGETC